MVLTWEGVGAAYKRRKMKMARSLRKVASRLACVSYITDVGPTHMALG